MDRQGGEGGAKTCVFDQVFTLNLFSRHVCLWLKVCSKCVGGICLQGDFLHWASPKKLMYGKPRLGESRLTYIVLDTPSPD